MSGAARLAAEDRPGPKRGVVAAFLLLAAWLSALVGEAGAPIANPIGTPSIGASTIADSAPAPRFTGRHATDSRIARPDLRTGDPIDGGGGALPAVFVELPVPPRLDTPPLPLSSDPLAAHHASGFHARAPPRG